MADESLYRRLAVAAPAAAQQDRTLETKQGRETVDNDSEALVTGSLVEHRVRTRLTFTRETVDEETDGWIWATLVLDRARTRTTAARETLDETPEPHDAALIAANPSEVRAVRSRMACLRESRSTSG